MNEDVRKESDEERCTMLTCFFNDYFRCLSCDDKRDPEKYEDCPSFMED